jgi:hypothetical protein
MPKINAPSITENEAPKSENKKQKPVGENRGHRLGKPQLKKPNPRLGKPQLQGQSGNPNHYLYLGVKCLRVPVRSLR